jgi:hypothetical protein
MFVGVFVAERSGAIVDVGSGVMVGVGASLGVGAQAVSINIIINASMIFFIIPPDF